MTQSIHPLERLRQIQEAERQGEPVPSPGLDATGDAVDKKSVGIWAGIGGILLLLFGKAKGLGLFILLKGKALFAALKLAPLVKTFGTMCLSWWAYAHYYGWKLALGVLLLILVHELGHGWAARFMGIRVGAPVFIPFFGAVIALKERPRTPWVDSVIGLGGPIAGSFGGLMVFGVAEMLGQGPARDLLVVIAWFTFLLNFFNLMPVFKLDGDRISQPFEPWYWLPGCTLLGVVLWLFASVTGHLHPFMVFILVLGAFKGGRLGWRQYRAARGQQINIIERLKDLDEYSEELTVKPWQARASALAYFGLILILCVCLSVTEVTLPSVP